MKSIIILGVLTLTIQADVDGFDVSKNQPNANFSKAYNEGARFVYIKATEGTSNIDPKFSDHYIAATNARLIRGGYHTAQPDKSSGAAQANYFLAHGGAWAGDGLTLPGALHLEVSSSSKCYSLSASAMVAWIRDFSNTYHSKTGRYPAIYSSPSWWKDCTGNSNSFGNTNPLWLANIASSIGPIPGGWPYQTIWQYANSGKLPGNQNKFNGDENALRKLATG